MPNQDKFRGCLIGGAAGDAPGYTVEFLQEGQIFRRYGERGITEYDLTGGIAQISDDTQMSLFTANGLLLGMTRGMTRGIDDPSPSYKFTNNTYIKKQEMIITERKRIHHIGIVIPGRNRVHDFLNIFQFEIDREEYVEAYHAQCIFTKCKENEVALEFIIPTEGVLTQYNNGKGGLRHIALEVEDVEATRQEYESQGRQMLEKKAVPGACGNIVNFRVPKSEQVFWLNLCSA